MGIRPAVKRLLMSSSHKKLEFLVVCFWNVSQGERMVWLMLLIHKNKKKCFPEKMSLHLSKGISHIVWPSAAHSWYCLFWEVMINSRLLISALCMSAYCVLSAYLVVMTGPCTVQKNPIHMGHCVIFMGSPPADANRRRRQCRSKSQSFFFNEGFCLWLPFFPRWRRQTSWIPNSQSTETCLGAATSAPSCFSYQ